MLQASLAEERISFGFLRAISGDQVSLASAVCATMSAMIHAIHTLLQDSKLVKFAFYVFVGSSANVMAKVCLHRLLVVFACHA